MIPIRRLLGHAALAALVAVAALALGSCGKNELMGQGLERLIVPKGAGPTGIYSGADPAPWKWAVNSIDSVLFTDDIDSTFLEVTSFQLLDTQGRLIPGTTRFMPGNQYIYYTNDFPDPSYDFIKKDPPSSSLSKVYFIPDRPLSGHTIYTYQLTTGVRMVSGQFRRDVQSFSFVTGDSVPPAGAPR